LTKNAAVQKDFDLIEQHRDRVLVGLSLTATPANSAVMQVVEPDASPVTERLEALREAHRRGLRTYAMLCPLLPGVADSAAEVGTLVEAAVGFGAEEFFVEPLNARGPGLILTADALRKGGFADAAEAVDDIRRHVAWSAYTRRLLETVQTALRRYRQLDRLRYLLYPGGLTEPDAAWIKAHAEGVVWLGK
jgi:DNA repair photolyase